MSTRTRADVTGDIYTAQCTLMDFMEYVTLNPNSPVPANIREAAKGALERISALNAELRTLKPRCYAEDMNLNISLYFEESENDFTICIDDSHYEQATIKSIDDALNHIEDFRRNLIQLRTHLVAAAANADEK